MGSTKIIILSTLEEKQNINCFRKKTVNWVVCVFKKFLFVVGKKIFVSYYHGTL